MASQEEEVSEVEAFCANEECREPIVIVEDDGYTCKGCGAIFCQICIEYIAKELDLEYYMEEEDGFCPECADVTRQELAPDTEEGQRAREMENRYKVEYEEHKKASQTSRRARYTNRVGNKYTNPPYSAQPKKK
jgi:uncharacterized protein with von Willebrand factor type A (vWA) domain